ncbi:hypothetical protein ABPG72_016812 [Tetrahymena utriculariae]
MGSCCSYPDKIQEKEHEQQSQNENSSYQGNTNSKVHSKGDIVNHQSQIHGETKREDTNQFDSQDNNQPLTNSMHKQNTPNSVGKIPSNTNIQPSIVQSGTNIQLSSYAVQHRNSGGFNQAMNPSMMESSSLNGNQRPGTIIQGNKDDLGSQKAARLDTQEREFREGFVDASIQQYIVRTKDQMQNSDMQKFLFLCRNDTSKSFILQISHPQAQQQGSTQTLFEVAQKYVKQQYSTDAISLELLFGMQNMQKSLQYHQDSFPAYFKTKEIFEDPYYIQVQLPPSAKNQGNPTWIQQLVFASMTIDDAKKELCKIEPNLNINACSMYKIIEDQNNASPLQSKGRINTQEFNANPQNFVPLLDEEKFGLNSHDQLFAIRNMDDDKTPIMNGSQVNGVASGNEIYWPSDNTQQGSSTQEVQLKKKDEQPYRKVLIGINIEYECKNSQCKLNGKRAVKNVGIGIYDLTENSKLSCLQCKSNQNTQIHQIGFYQCRFAYTGIQDLKKKSSPKWQISFSSQALKKLDQKEVLRKPSHNHQNWSYFLDTLQWTRFKLYAKRISNYHKLNENEEFLHSLQLEDVSSHKMCGVCKQNVQDQMQHTLDCGHSFHKLCLNLLPPLFSSIRCPLCVNF